MRTQSAGIRSSQHRGAAPPRRRPARCAPGRPRAGPDAPSGRPACRRRDRRRRLSSAVAASDAPARRRNRSAPRRCAGWHRGAAAELADSPRAERIGKPCREYRRPAAPPRYLLGAVELEARHAEQVAEHPQDLPGGARLAQRPDHTQKLCSRPSVLTKDAGGLGERRDRQQHVRVVERAVPERRHRDDELRAAHRGERLARIARSPARARR